MSRWLIGTLLVTAFLAGQVQPVVEASEPKVELPQRPFTGDIPNRTSWVVTIERPWLKNSGSPATAYAGKTLEKIEFSYQDGVRREILHYDKGEPLTRFIAGRMVLYVNPENGEPRLDDAQSSLSGPTYGSTRFAELGWIKEGFFAGETVREGRKFHVYKNQPAHEEGSVEEGLEPESSIPPGAIALIDTETNLPVEHSFLGTVWRYRFDEKFRPFVLPGELQNLIKQREAQIEEMKQWYQSPE